jgi:hypothetical protein
LARKLRKFASHVGRPPPPSDATDHSTLKIQVPRSRRSTELEASTQAHHLRRSAH